MKKASEIISNFPGCDRIENLYNGKYVIQGVNFSNTSFKGTRLDLSKILFIECDFTNCNFTECPCIYPSDEINAERCDFTRANFKDIQLILCDFKDCTFHETDFSKASMWSTCACEWDLSTAKIDPVWEDMFEVLTLAVSEIPALEKAIANGKIDGSIYDDGFCGCLNGTLWRAAKEVGDTKSAHNLYYAQINKRPIEIFCWDISEGDRPETNWKLKAITEKIQEFKSKLN